MFSRWKAQLQSRENEGYVAQGSVLRNMQKAISPWWSSAYNLLSAPGEISTGEVENFQPSETGEYSTGVDTDWTRHV
jgi:hypothetical protein